MTTGFTDLLRQENLAQWQAATGHEFVSQLVAGTVSDAVMGRYLIQDHRFLDSFLMLIGGAMANADTYAARLRFGQFAGMVSGEENTYFLRAFDALGISETARAEIPDSAPTAGFKSIMAEAGRAGSYAAALAVLNVVEGVYADWASAAPRPLQENFIHAEWVTLHDNPGFNAFVAFLRAEFDRVGPTDPQISRDFFARACDLEVAFFDSAFDL